VPGAARVAYWLTATLWGAGEVAVGNGWLSKGRRLLDELAEDVVERGYLQERVTLGHIMKGEFPHACKRPRRSPSTADASETRIC
jgi:hypothetical protein